MAYTESPRAVTNGRIRTLPLVGLGANPIRRSQISPGSESSRAPGGALECFLTGTPPEIPEIRTPLLYPRNPRSVSCLTRPVLRNRQVIGSSPIAGSRFSTTYHPTPSTPAQSRRYSRCDSASGEVAQGVQERLPLVLFKEPVLSPPRFAWPRTWRFPQRCLRSDRLSATSGSYEEVLRSELRRGVEVVESGETVDSAASFARGQGRHGPF